MTFHALQSVGDLMARASNDIREVNYIFSPPGINMVFGSMNFLFIPLIIGGRIHPALLITPVLFIIAYFFGSQPLPQSLTTCYQQSAQQFWCDEQSHR